MRKLMEVVDGLRQDGIAQQGIALPQIAVVGDQSSGKSSVLENITGIPFPKGTGTVTKCATRITIRRALKRTTPFSARVSFVINGKNSPFKNEGPKMNHTSVGKLQKTLERLNELIHQNESKTDIDDIIEVDIEERHDSDAVDLSIVDLPGLIATTTEGQSKDLVGSIEKMVSRYAEDKRTVILAIMEAHRDISNSRALAMAEKADEKGERTVGVLTKMDLVEEATEDDVLNVLNNSRKPLYHGYFAVMNRAQKTLNEGKSLKDARRDEKEWFERNKHYMSMDGRCGIDNLKRGISKRLRVILSKGVPEILLQSTQPLFEEKETLWAKQLTLRRQFKNGIQAVQPDFPADKYKCRLAEVEPKGERKTKDISDKKVNKSSYLITRCIPVNEGDIVEAPIGSVVEFLKKNTRLFGVVESESRSPDGKRLLKIDLGKYTSLEQRLTNLAYFQRFKVIQVQCELGEQDIHSCSELRKQIAQDIQRFRGEELPGFPNFAVFKRYFTMFTAAWKEPTYKLNRRMADAFEAKAKQMIQTSCSHLNVPRLEKLLLQTLNSWFIERKTEISSQLEKYLSNEQSMPMTENHHFIDNWKRLREQRMVKQLLRPFQGDGDISREEVRKVISDNIQSTGYGYSNEIIESMDLIDGLRAYYKVVEMRYIDGVSQKILCAYFDDPVHKDLHKVLKAKALENMKQIFKYDDDFLFQRDALKKKLTVLESGYKRLAEHNSTL
eukprot:jgi/Bigna1/92655/estExt_fgenesh1_pm.C_470007